MTREERAEQWFKHIVDNKQFWCHGFTIKRLDKVRPHVLGNKDIMWDLLDRHNGKDMSPEELKSSDQFSYEHCIGNLATSILYMIMDHKMIKH